MSDQPKIYQVCEVHNFGGFFGGDTVTLSAAERGASSGEQTLTIDQAALVGIADRHTVVAGMLFSLVFAGERVERAELLGAATHAQLRAALGPADLPASLTGPLVLSQRCEHCGLWVAGSAAGADCQACAR
ncbi:MAG: hypothetical protein H7Z42_19635 [Roseiflexaceae bacterium]|nr:hypothetical protein [Roseiflexaceae bacterium]